MDSPELPLGKLEAGQAYYEALGKLGFNPEGLLWAYDTKEKEYRLWLVWSGLDNYGPLAISKLLFKAYRAAALPAEIDPFTVYVVQPEHLIGQLSSTMLDKNRNINPDHVFRITTVEPHKAEDKHVLQFVRATWVYHLEDKRFNQKKIKRDWKTFNENVSALAA